MNLHKTKTLNVVADTGVEAAANAIPNIFIICIVSGIMIWNSVLYQIIY